MILYRGHRVGRRRAEMLDNITPMRREARRWRFRFQRKLKDKASEYRETKEAKQDSGLETSMGNAKIIQ